MKIKLYRSATIGIEANGYKLLSDPWLTDGEYYGSWSHYPYYDLDNNLNEINSYNGIYISHIHPDHCSENTLKKISKKIPVYIHNYLAPFLKLKIEGLGFKVIEIANGETFNLNHNLEITIFAADDCNPEKCYKFLGCADLNKSGGSQQIDSLIVIKNKENIILNVNDCPYDLSKNVIKKIIKKFKKIDVLLTGYGGAGPYPQCIDNFNKDEKIIEAKKKQKNFLNQTLDYLKIVKPEFYLPFAGTYTLSGKLSSLQSLRGVPNIDEAYDYIDCEINKIPEIKGIKSIKINPGSIFDLKKKTSDNKYEKFNHKNFKEYISNNLSKKKLSYENDEIVKFDEILSLAKLAHKRYLNKIGELNIKLDTNIMLDVADKYIIIPFNDNQLKIINKNEFNGKKKFVIYRLDLRLLKNILKGPKFAHWNNAEIGSHINFFREPNIYDRKLYFGMNFFHA